MTNTNYTGSADAMEIVRLGKEAMCKDVDTLTDDEFGALEDFADFSTAIAKTAHRDGENCAAQR